MKKVVSYAESSDEEDEDVFASLKSRKPRQRRSKTAVSDDEDEDAYDAGVNEVEDDDGKCSQPIDIKPLV